MRFCNSASRLKRKMLAWWSASWTSMAAALSVTEKWMTDQPEINGDTLFEIGSITKTFTALLLQDMIERGEMKLDDPVAKILAQVGQVPTHNGREITLLHLATHTSGLPRNPKT